MSIVQRAAERYGKKNPSPDDIIMEVTPLYHEDPEHTALWHKLMREVMAVVTEPVPNPQPGDCIMCGRALYGRQTKYCDRRCKCRHEHQRRRTKLDPRICENCGVTVYPTERTEPGHWRRRRFCVECGRRSRYL